jgi:hypothetical protein
MQFLTYLTAVVAFLTSIVSAIDLKDPLPTLPLPVNFVPSAVNPWSFNPDVPDTIFLNGEAFAPGAIVGTPQALPVKALTAAPAGSRKNRNLRGSSDARALQGSGVICTLVAISLGIIDINIAGLVVSIPQETNIDVLGKVGLLGELLCGLLSGSGLIANIVNGLIAGIEGLTSIADGLQALVDLLNAAV